MVLFKPYHYTFGRLEGLPDGVIPIFPSEIKFNIPHQGQMIRHLLAITAGYAFTDYKSQGQTIECVIVDLGKPPWGALTAFNTYVALSQSHRSGCCGISKTNCSQHTCPVRGHAFPTFSVVLRCHIPPSDVGAHRAYHGPYRVTSHLRIYHVPALLDLAYV